MLAKRAKQKRGKRCSTSSSVTGASTLISAASSRLVLAHKGITRQFPAAPLSTFGHEGPKGRIHERDSAKCEFPSGYALSSFRRLCHFSGPTKPAIQVPAERLRAVLARRRLSMLTVSQGRCPGAEEPELQGPRSGYRNWLRIGARDEREHWNPADKQPLRHAVLAPTRRAAFSLLEVILATSLLLQLP